MSQTSACGLECRECRFLGATCPGCAASEGRPFWTAETGLAACPIHHCATTERGYSNCGQCGSLPCDTFTKLRDPSMSDEEFQRSLGQRIARLKEAQS